MSGIESSFFDIGTMDTISRQDTLVHRMDPRIKVLTTLVFIVCVVSFGKHDISALVPFLIYPLFSGGPRRFAGQVSLEKSGARRSFRHPDRDIQSPA